MKGHALQKGSDDLVFIAIEGQSTDKPPCLRLPIRCAQARERGHHIYAIGLALGTRKGICGFGGMLDQAQLIPQPLYGDTGDEYAAF